MRSLIIVLTLLISSGFGYDLLDQDFDTTWTPNQPPGGWRIFHTDTTVQGDDDWHRQDSITVPWGGHPTPYASIYYDLHADPTPDSLITPVINCTGYSNVTLTCSTYFAMNGAHSYIAQLRYSVDGGATFPYLLRDYQNINVGPALEIFSLGYAANEPTVVIAWVFDGNSQHISHWSIDDVVVSGDSILDWDIRCRRIVYPPTSVLPGNMDPQARFRNVGQNDQYDIPVECRLFDSGGTQLQAWSDTIDTLFGLGDQTVVTFAPAYGLTPGDYRIQFWCAADSDQNRSNDTLSQQFTVSFLEDMHWDNGSVSALETWPVGHYGWGAKFTPGSYPVYLESLRVYLRCPVNPNYCRYQLAVVRDVGGVPGKTWWKSPVLSGRNGVTGWNSIYVADSGRQIEIESGSFYLFYLQVGEPPECPELGRDNSRSSGADYWQYRAGTYVPDSTNGDFMIRAYVNHEALTPEAVDLRAMFVDQPWYEFVQRPYDAPVTPTAGIHNNGTLDLTGIVAACSIFGAGNVLRYVDVTNVATLGVGADTLVEFAPWTPIVSEHCSVTVHVSMPLAPQPDTITWNDDVRFGTQIRKGVHTGVSPSAEYGWIDSDTLTGPGYSWVSTDSADWLPLSGDEFRIYVPIGFNFPYYDTTYNNVYVSINGWLSFGDDPGTNESLPAILPDVNPPNRALYVYWDNLACGPSHGSGKVWYRVLGTAPNRRFAVIWKDMNRLGTDTTDLISFECILHENGHITYQYEDVVTGDLNYDNGRNACIGLENQLGNDGFCYLYARPPMSGAVNDLENRVTAGTAIRLNPVLRDAAALDILAPTGYVFPQLITPYGKIQNYGTVADSIKTFMKIKPGYIDSVTVYGLAPGDSVTIMFQPWDAQVGVFSAVCSTWMAGDVDSTNNTVSAVVVVSPWIQRPDIPFGWRRRKVKGACLTYVPTENKLYSMKGSNTDELWTFDIATGEWDTISYMPALPSGRKPKYGCDLAFDPDHGDKGTLWATKGGGRTDFYQYDIDTRVWIERCPVGKGINVEGYRPPKKGSALAYVPHRGLDGSVFCLIGNNTNLLFAYDIAADTWEVMFDAHGNRLDVPWGSRYKRCKYGSDMEYGDGNIYVLKGSNTFESYELDPLTQIWRELDSTRLYKNRKGRRRKVKAGASMCYLDSTLYILKGGNKQEFWKYPLAQDSWVQMTDIPIALEGRRRKPKRGSALAGVDSTIFCLKGSYSFEFWEYKPDGDTAAGAFFGPRPVRSGVFDAGPAGLKRPVLAVHPNPTRGRMAVRYAVPHPGRARITIYDATGRMVRRLLDGPIPAGLHTIHWDGRSDRHARVPNGVYLLKFETNTLVVTRKIVLQD